MKAKEAFAHVVRELIEYVGDLRETNGALHDANEKIAELEAQNASLIIDADRMRDERDAEIIRWRMISERCERMEKEKLQRDGARDTACARLYQWAEVSRDLLRDRSHGRRLTKENTERCINHLGDALKEAWQYCDQIPF